MGEDAQRLIDAVAPLWPSSSPVVTRRGGGRSDAYTWLILPSLRQPILLVPPDNAGAEVALRPRGTGHRQLKMHVLAALQRGRMLRFLPLPRLCIPPTTSGDSAHEVVARALGEPADIVVRLGR